MRNVQHAYSREKWSAYGVHEAAPGRRRLVLLEAGLLGVLAKHKEPHVRVQKRLQM